MVRMQRKKGEMIFGLRGEEREEIRRRRMKRYVVKGHTSEKRNGIVSIKVVVMKNNRRRCS